MKNLMERTFTGIIMLGFLAITIFLGNRTLFIMGAVLSIIAFFELNYVLGFYQVKASRIVTIPFGMLALVSLYFGRIDWVFSLLLLLVVIDGVRSVLTQDHSPRTTIGSVFSFIYLFVNFGLLMVLPSQKYLFLIVIASWGCDTFAYIFGMLFGKHKLIPSVSPKKSVEGAIGGVVGSVFLSYLLLNYLQQPHILSYLIAVFFAAIFSQFGDLFASKMKREADLKDFGHIFLGHGGVLDRFDSMLFVIPFMYAISLWLPI